MGTFVYHCAFVINSSSPDLDLFFTWEGKAELGQPQPVMCLYHVLSYSNVCVPAVAVMYVVASVIAIWMAVNL